MFTPAQRDTVRSYVTNLAGQHKSVTGGAITGSRVAGVEDAWSDIDLAFGIRTGTEPVTFLDDITHELHRAFEVIHHWDLQSGPTTYRIFLLQGGLQLDVGATPQEFFGARGANFQALFGTSQAPADPSPPNLDEIAGYGWLAIICARKFIARGKLWEAAYFIEEGRNRALALACARQGLPTAYARGIDQLPEQLLNLFKVTLIPEISVVALTTALAALNELFIAEIEVAGLPFARQLATTLRESVAPNHA